jgi:hypothetical protein
MLGIGTVNVFYLSSLSLQIRIVKSIKNGAAAGATNTLGTACTLEELNSAEFYTATLGWDDEVWDLSDLDFEGGKYPVLKSEN